MKEREFQFDLWDEKSFGGILLARKMRNSEKYTFIKSSNMILGSHYLFFEVLLAGELG